MAYETILYVVSDNGVTIAHNRADRLWTANSSRRWFCRSSMKSPGTVPRAEDAPQSGGYVRCRRLAMKRLSLGDALFLYAETPETPMHVASVTIFRPATQGMISSLVSAST